MATLIGATARRIAAWPSTSSGDVGSSIQYGQVDGALVRPQPPQLAVPGQATGERTEIRQRFGHRHSHHQRYQRADGGYLHIVATPDRERETVPFLARTRPDGHVGRRVVGFRVHRVRPVQAQRGREPDVHGVHGTDHFGQRDHLSVQPEAERWLHAHLED
ncbi:hypothetical protein JOF56_009224 [Kibdelosporangium banguiense]|uniref:Uncharacterized protein n=1 Tax=Kibdelosporangium banguiense TaxID=1365924 RepID=A0ABS4TXX1_9PSEU|nr:hypothetical protein [Kibdelosporangium banguiense]